MFPSTVRPTCCELHEGTHSRQWHARGEGMRSSEEGQKLAGQAIWWQDELVNRMRHHRCSAEACVMPCDR